MVAELKNVQSLFPTYFCRWTYRITVAQTKCFIASIKSSLCHDQRLNLLYNFYFQWNVLCSLFRCETQAQLLLCEFYNFDMSKLIVIN